MSDRTRTKEKEAEKRGHKIIRPLANQLFIDIDSEAGLRQFEAGLSVCKEIELTGDIVTTPSPSGEPFHLHITVDLARNVTSEEERLMLQAMLGSDPMREILSWRELKKGDTDVTVFFEKADSE